MRRDLRVGIRVVLSAEAKVLGVESKGKHARRGRIVRARPPLGWVVLWDGRKTASEYHESFLRRVHSAGTTEGP